MSTRLPLFPAPCHGKSPCVLRVPLLRRRNDLLRQEPLPLRPVLICTCGAVQDWSWFMPVGRYFAFTGSVLLALLFLIDWYLPPSAVEPAGAGVDRSIIRIQSSHKWPSAVVFDTNQPTIVPPATVVTAEAPIARPSRDAFALVPQPALATAAAVPPPAPKHVTRRVRVARAPAARVDNYETIDFRNPFPPSW